MSDDVKSGDGSGQEAGKPAEETAVPAIKEVALPHDLFYGPVPGGMQGVKSFSPSTLEKIGRSVDGVKHRGRPTGW